MAFEYPVPKVCSYQPVPVIDSPLDVLALSEEPSGVSRIP
jgi:hypothetical protein